MCLMSIHLVNVSLVLYFPIKLNMDLIEVVMIQIVERKNHFTKMNRSSFLVVRLPGFI